MATTKTTNSPQLLEDFIYDELKTKPVLTKSGKGWMLYDVSENIDIQRLTSLVSAVNESWTTSYFEPEYEKSRKTKGASVYFGTKQNKNEIKRDSFLTSLKSV
tara:strand:+ start:336 stop:644 length:309 start_codon:yes stop_codon:yes gene_type:complete